MGKALQGQEASDYLKEWKALEEKKYRLKMLMKKERKELNAHLAQMDKQLPPTQMRQNAKRAEVARFRAKYPKKNDGR